MTAREWPRLGHCSACHGPALGYPSGHWEHEGASCGPRSAWPVEIQAPPRAAAEFIPDPVVTAPPRLVDLDALGGGGGLSRRKPLERGKPLDRGKGLAAGGALSRGAPMSRGAGLARGSGPVRKPAVQSEEERQARRIVRARSGGVCEGCGQAPAAHWAHRVGEGQGGPWCPSNGMHLCAPCHAWCHAHPRLAKERGWMLYPTRDPRVEPAEHWLHGRVLLVPDGSFTLAA